MTSRLLRSAVAAVAVIAFAVIAVGQTTLVPSGHRHKLRHVPPLPRPQPNGNIAQFGDPVLGLADAQLAAFTAGREEFESVETAEGGLGPIFNENSCAACHTTPLSGGAGTTTVTRFGKASSGHFDPLASEGGSLLQAMAIDPSLQEIVPADANVVAHRITTPLFGAGLIEAIPDAEIVLNALRPKPDGVTGRAAFIVDVTTGQHRVGHFGWKAQQATLLAFAGDAYLNEMGVTNRFFPTENAPNGNAALLAPWIRTSGVDDPADPVTGRSDIDASADFMRLLAPPPPVQLTASAQGGKRLFAQINCDACHQPVLFSGPSPIEALAFKPVPLYSDLLLHDMGALGDGIEQSAAQAREIKTPALWGLRVRPALLHDGRAKTVSEAILGHAGEASAARDRFARMSAAERRQLLDFLASI